MCENSLQSLIGIRISCLYKMERYTTQIAEVSIYFLVDVPTLRGLATMNL